MILETVKVKNESAMSGYSIINKADLSESHDIYEEAASSPITPGSVPWLKSEIERLGGEFGARDGKPKLEEILKDLTEG